MDLFLLGAGKPYSGKKPSSLKKILFNNNALEWQIQTFKQAFRKSNINFLGGYNIDLIIKKFPQLNITIVPDWRNNTILNSFLNSPFTSSPAFVSYADTIFNKETMLNMQSYDKDIVVCIDSLWQDRYPLRTSKDINSAEKIILHKSKKKYTVEFTGLVFFNKKAVNYLKKINKYSVGNNLIDLIFYLKKKKFKINYYDVMGQWAEFNLPQDVARFILGSKAETLEKIKPFTKSFFLTNQLYFTVKEWDNNQNKILNKIKKNFSQNKIIIRSSSGQEDSWTFSNAGAFKSFANIDSSNRNEIIKKINKVIKSYQVKNKKKEQILIQEYLTNIKLSGVVFTCSLETGAPYYRFNFDDISKSTSSVTSGKINELRNIILSKFQKNILKKIEPNLFPVLKSINEIENLLNYSKLDIEFAVTKDNKVYLLQIRPISVDHSDYEFDQSYIQKSLKENALFFEKNSKNNSFSFVEKKIFANMPDWNPAEIIGSRPKPLAFSLYRYLITDETWALQRHNFGYQDLRSLPLVYSFTGQPYVDVNASLNSFIPADLSDKIKKKLSKAYANILADNPHLHDKIEFDIAFTIWVPNFLKIALKRLGPYGVSKNDILKLEVALKKITCCAFKRLKKDIDPINFLIKRKESIISSKIDIINKILYLIKDCKNYGSISFAHAARAGFISNILLKNFVNCDYISQKREISYLNSIKTINGQFMEDKINYQMGKLNLKKLIEKYGHLRPGTYEINNEAYWENPKKYFLKNKKLPNRKKSTFAFSQKEIKNFKFFIKELGSNIKINDFIKYLSNSIKARELIKYEFTKNLSCFLDLIIQFKDSAKLSRDDLSYLELNDFFELKINKISIDNLKEKITYRKNNYNLTKMVELPFLIKNKEDFYCFEKYILKPNFITLNKVESDIAIIDSSKKNYYKGKILVISEADPGYDWIFGLGIVGLITKFGGANSHMAIRAAEINLPAAIGVGDKLYEQLLTTNRIFLDCENKVINFLA